MSKKHPASINLVKGTSNNFFNKFIDWALTIGRLLIIITEIVALSSFLYRFTLDRQIIDLHSKIRQQESLVSFFASKEDMYRNLQGRLEVASNFSSIGQDRIKNFKDVTSFAPLDMTFSNITVTEKSIDINASFQSASSLKTFINSLREYPPIQDVSINKIENRLSNAQIITAVTASLKSK